MSQEFATHVVSRLVEAGFTAYWAGGCVRDLLRNVPPHDYDVATSATPDEVRQVFGPRRTLAVGESFGVVIVLGSKGSQESIEVATFRREGEYLDGRRPSGVEFCTPEVDASRRDFTINGMFYDPLTQNVHDYVGGQMDLHRKLLRAIGDPHARIAEDKLRMLRAIRFAAALEFTLDSTTAAAIRKMAGEVIVVSAERIAHELRKMLTGRQRARAMQLFDELGLMSIVLPEVTECTILLGSKLWEERLEVLQQLQDPTFEMAMAALLRDVPAPSGRSSKDSETSGTVHRLCRRLKLSNQETDVICWLVEHRGQIAALPQAPLHQVKRLLAHPLARDLFYLERTAAAVAHQSDEEFAWVEDYLRVTPPEELDPAPLLTGSDLLALGLRSGPEFKRWLHQIRDAQLNNELITREHAIDWIKQHAQSAD